jgi:beta-lactamase superfamily II metal-dependent hydrolase
MAGSVRVRVLDVGEGDAIVGILPGGRRAFVVDIRNSDRVLDFLAGEGVSEVVLFLSHSDRDHTAGASDFIADFAEAGRILAVFYNHDRLNARMDGEYRRLTRLIGQFSQLQTRVAPRYLYADFNTNLNRVPDFNDLFPHPSSVRVIHPERADQSVLIGQDVNETAGVLMVRCEVGPSRYRSMLLAADIQLTGVSLLLGRESREPLAADVLKFPHHGAWPAQWPGISGAGVPRRTLEDFVRSVAPAAVIVSTGFANPYHHVREEVFDLLEEYHRDTGRLTSLKCTQFTTTCSGAPSLPKSGPLTAPHCAGDVEVRMGPGVGDGGIEIVTAPADHPGRVVLVDRAGRARCRFVPEIAERLAQS